MEHRTPKQRQRHPQDKGNFLQHIFFCWELSLFLKGLKKELDEDDLYSHRQKQDATLLGNKLEELWRNEKHVQKKPSLLKALVKQFGLEVLFYGLLYLPVNLASLLLKPFLLTRILDYFSENPAVTLNDAYGYASMLIVLIFIHFVVFNFILLEMNTVGIKMRTACTSLIYRHILKLKQTEMQQITVGKLINLLSTDVSKFDEALAFCIYIWVTPVQLIACICYLNFTYDPTTMVGMAVLIIFMLLNAYFSKNLQNRRDRIAHKTDTRLGLVNDVISGIQTIKMHTWEEPFTNLVEKARNMEVAEIRKANYLRLLSASSELYILPLSILVVVLTTPSALITPQYVYSLLWIYQVVLSGTICLLPHAVGFVGECKASIERIQEVLLIGGSATSLDRYIPKHAQHEVAIHLEDVSVKFKHSHGNILNSVSFDASPGDLVVIAGRAGSGKSVLLEVILKEVGVTNGTVNADGTISYASQTPWIFSASVRQNILFGDDFDSEKYQRVIKVCALEQDLSVFPHGDDTLVGEKGLMLSGGQKTRISLARAIYRTADIYLLDDPLSAVDSYVAKHIFEECILKYLKDRCVILVTHQVQFLQNAKKIYILENGRLRVKHEGVFYLEESARKSSKTISFEEGALPEEIKEHRSSGYNISNVYRRYFLAAGHWTFTVGVVVALMLAQSLKNATDWFLSLLTEARSKPGVLTQDDFFLQFVILSLCLVLVSCGSSLILVRYFSLSSKHLHKRLFSSVVKAKMAFFHFHPSGQILNRFSQDCEIIDEILPLTVYLVAIQSLMFLGMVVVVSLVNKWMVFPSLILIVIVGFLYFVYRRTNTDIIRTELITKSYVLSHVTATLQGLTTVRALNAQSRLIMELEKHQNFQTSAAYVAVAIYHTLGFWTSMVYLIYVGVVVFSLLMLSTNFSIGSVGLGLSISISLVDIFQVLMQDSGLTDCRMISVERTLEYIDLPPETDLGAVVPVKEWPNEGNIIFDSVSLRYLPDKPQVLKQVTFHVSSGQKIGIVGRTGAGKTSLVSTLFRLTDFEGTIIIDGLDTKSLPLSILRSKISIIPQDPVLFIGTFRKNLDPFDQFTDQQIWAMLNELELQTVFPHLPKGLESEIEEGGCNFSVGQKQLLCLVRVMLQQSKIIVLDEATANVDHETDAIIQAIIKRKFQNCTVLTVAHRLNTVIDSDKILVMENGRVMEFDHPYKLLQNSESLFYGYVKENGEDMLQDLIRTANLSFDCKRHIK